MNSLRNAFLRPLGLAIAILALPHGLGAAPDGENSSRKPPFPKPDSGEHRHGPDQPEHDREDRKDPLRNLTPEQRDELREAVRKAWSDPVVLEARDKLKSAAEDYQNALNAAIKRSSPELAEAIDSLREEIDSPFRHFGPGPSPGRGGGEPGGPGGGRRDWRNYEGFLTMENPPFLRDLSPEQQKLYREVHARAMQAPNVKSRLDSLRELRKSDDEIRRERIEQIRRVHAAIRKAMTEIDPRMQEFLPERTRPPGNEGEVDPSRPPRPDKPPRE